MRVVFDTNILVSAFAIPGGRAEEALLKITAGEDQLIVSKAAIDELLGVLARKFRRDQEELARLAVYLADLGELVEPTRRVAVLLDEPDNRILECALAGNADAVVTGDQEMLRLGRYEGVRILSLRAYLEAGGGSAGSTQG